MSAGSLRQTRTMAEENGARCACSVRRNCTRAEGNRARDTGSLRRYCTVRIYTDGVGARGLVTEAICAALLDRLATGTRASCETNGGGPDGTVGGRVGCRHRTVTCRRGTCKAGARSGFRSGCGQPLGAFREEPREQKRRARVGRHHGGQTCMGYRGYRCDCLPGPGPGGTLAIDLNDSDDVSYGCEREKTCRRDDS